MSNVPRKASQTDYDSLWEEAIMADLNHNEIPENAEEWRQLVKRIRTKFQKKSLSSNLESIFLDGIVLTNPLVDYIHGVLPEETSAEKKKRLQDLFVSILEAGEEIVTRCQRLHNLDDYIVDIPDRGFFKGVMFNDWHHLCQMRRIVWRISGAINGKFHRKALINGKHEISVNSLVRLRQLRSRIVTMIIQHSKDVLLDISLGRQIYWSSIATAYEAAIILRAKGDIGAAIDLANKVRNCKNKIIKPRPNDSIEGLISFNYRFWEGVYRPLDDEDDEDFLFKDSSTPQGNLMALSEIVSRNSHFAAPKRLNTNRTIDQRNLIDIVLRINSVCNDKNLNVKPSSISHIEGLFRVLVYQAITNSEFMAQLDFNTRVYVSLTLQKTVPSMFERCKFDDKWIENMLRADLKQKLGIFLASNTKSFLLDDKSTIPAELSEIFSQEVKDEVSELAVNVWENPSDSDAVLRKDYRRSAIRDLSLRLEQDGDQHLSKLTDLLGNPCEPNPLTARGLAKWFSNDKGKSDGENSRHLRLFPQGKINESQVAVSMALMQQIMRLETGNGVWKNLGNIIKLDDKEGRKNPWKISKFGSGPRLQFTVGYFSGSYEIGNLDDENINPIKLKRQYLTRVNKADEIMLISNAISMMSEVIHSQLQKSVRKPEHYFLENLFLCENDELFIDRDDEIGVISNPSLQELFYLSREISNSPIRVFDPIHHARLLGRKKMKEDDLIRVFDNILRISFARIYSLTVATEHLARILVQRPLREPFLSCCVLLVDQIRVLLQKLQGSLISAYQSQDYNPLEGKMFNETIFDNLNKMKNKFKPNYFKNLKQIDLIDHSDDEITEVRSDLAIEYLLAYKRTREEQVECLNRLQYKLNFERNIGRVWSDIFQNAVKLRYDSPEPIHDDDQINAIAPDWDSEYVRVEKNDKDVIELFDKLVSENPNCEQLRVLWSRLVYYPTAFVGRVLVNANSPREINEGEEPIPLLFGNKKVDKNPKDTFVSNQ